MEILVAIGHIVGAFVTSVMLGMIILLVSSWEIAKNTKRANEELALELGVPVSYLEDEERIAKLSQDIIRVLMGKFSDELFVNRVSDFLGIIHTLWGWAGYIIQVFVLVTVCWYTFTENLENAIYAWLVNVVAVLFVVASVVFSAICKIVTGRYPGQAKEARKLIVNFHNQVST